METSVIRIAVVVALSVLVSGCTVSGWSCAGWDKISASRQDTDLTKAQILAHNEFGRKQGCW